MRTWQKRAAVALMVGGLGATGCVTTNPGPKPGLEGYYWNFVDPCWPERYNAAARAEVVAPFATQVNNGHVLNQTLWNWYFEYGSDKLTTAGMAKIDSLVRTRPGPDPRLYLQSARDVTVTNENMDQAGELRRDLTARRAATVQRYLATMPNIQPVAYEIYEHDATPPGIPAEFMAAAFRGTYQGYRGGLMTGGPIQSQSTGANQPVPTTVINNGGQGAAPGGGTGGGTGGTGGTGGGTGGSSGGSSSGGSSGSSGSGSRP